VKKLLLVATACGLLVLSGSAFARCTEDDVTKKTADLQTAMTAYVKKHPDKAAEVSAMVSTVNVMAAKLRLIGKKNPNDDDEICKLYDDMIADMK